MKSYRVDVLDVARTTNTSIASSTDVFSAVGDGATGNNASTTSVASEAEADFWSELQDNISAIIAQAAPQPRTVTTEGVEAVMTAPADTASTPAAPVGADQTSPSAETASAGADGQQQAETISQATAAAVSAASPQAMSASIVSDADAPVVDEDVDGNNHYFTINRQAGVVSVFTTDRQHKEIEAYLDELRANVGAQVLIEAKIVEVNLDEQFRAGIDWTLISNQDPDDFNIVGNFADDVLPSDMTAPTIMATGNFTWGASSIASALELVDSFGTTRTLSSPRLTVLNNHNAILKVAENEVYFTIEIEREVNDDGPDIITYDSDVHTVPVGVILNVQPSINRETQEISLNLRPTISRIVRQVNDPAVALFAADIGIDSVQSPIPVVEVRELDSLVTVQSGEVLILGGLMQERAENSDAGIPYVKDVPVLGSPFKRKLEETDVIELVIFLRATIVNGRDSISPADRELYNKFTPDPRPIAF